MFVFTFVSDLKRRLANWYIQEYSHIPFAPSRPENEVTMRQLYVAPKIVEKGQELNGCSKNTVKTFNDFFKKEGSLCKNIFLLGEPGTGKSTFLQNIAIEWSELHMQQNDMEKEKNDKVVVSGHNTIYNEIIRSDDDIVFNETSKCHGEEGSSIIGDDSHRDDDSASRDESNRDDDSASRKKSNREDDDASGDDSHRDDDSASRDESNRDDDDASRDDSNCDDDSASRDKSNRDDDGASGDDSHRDDDSASRDESNRDDDSASRDDSNRDDDSASRDESNRDDDGASRDDSNRDDDWFQDKTTLKIIDVLFYVSLRDASNYCDYVDIINDQLLRNIYREDEIGKANSLVKRLLESPSSFILSDGLDEWEHPPQIRCSCPVRDKGRTPLFHQPNSATIVTTSRPWRFAQKAPRSSKVEKFLEIEGTSNAEKLGKKMVDVLNKQEGKCIKFGDVQSYVRKKRVDDLMTVPIILLQIVCLFFEGKEVSNSQCKIYASIIDMMIGRCSQTFFEQSSTCDTRMSLFYDKVNIRQFWTQFIALAKLAFEQFFQNHDHSVVVFNSKTCNLDDDVKTFARVCGLLTEKKSRSCSSSVAHLSFIHKTFQEYLAAVYISINEEVFESVVKPRHDVPDLRPLHDLVQVFIFTCGLNIQMAEKIATIFNKHTCMFFDMEMKRSAFADNPRLWYCGNYIVNLIQKGIFEADENGFKHCIFPLQVISMTICDEYYESVCLRLLDMNNERLISVCIENLLYESSQHLSMHLQSCMRLKHLMLDKLDLGDERLLLADTLTNIIFTNVEVTEGISLQNCTQLQTIKLESVNIGKNQLILPHSLTHIDIDCEEDMNLLLSAQNLKHLQELKLRNITLSDHELLLPNGITSLCLDCVSTASGRNRHRNTSSKQTELHGGAYSYLHVYRVCVGTLRLNNCTKLKKLVLKNISYHKLRLPESINSITLCHINGSMSKIIPQQHFTRLQKLKVKVKNLGDKRRPPDTITEILQLQNCSQLIKLKIESMDLTNINLKLPDSITKIGMKFVTMSELGVHELCQHFQRLPNAVTLQIMNCTIWPITDHERFFQSLKKMTFVDKESIWKYETIFEYPLWFDLIATKVQPHRSFRLEPAC